MRTRRSGVSCIGHKGSLYVLGGFNGNRRLNSCEKFELVEKKWVNLPGQMLTSRSNFTSAVVDGKITVFGGFDGYSTTRTVERYNDIQHAWSRCCDLTLDRSALTACVISGINLDKDSLAKYLTDVPSRTDRGGGHYVDEEEEDGFDVTESDFLTDEGDSEEDMDEDN